MAKYSIVVAAYNEEKALPLYYDAMTPAMESLGEEYEIIFINDGSVDGTKEVLNKLAEKDKRVKVIHFSRNFRQQAGFLCGFTYATGDAIITMDADLQDPPEVVLQMIEKWKEGYQIVHGKRSKREGEGIVKRGTAYLFHSIMRKITKLDIPMSVGDFKLYDRKVINVLLSLGEQDRFLRAQAAWVGFTQTFVEFDRPARVAGETHYTLKKLMKLAGTGIFPNTDYPLHFSLKFGVLGLALSLACMITFIVLGCCGVYYGGLTAWLFPTIALVGSGALIANGISNIYIYMIFKETQDRPKYVVDETVNLEK